MYGRYGFEEKNKIGHRILDFTSAYELTNVNTFFRKKEENYITY